MTDFTPQPPSCNSPQNTPLSIMQYLKCSICIDVLKEPVTTTCGHTFCKSCLDRHITCSDQQCPLCKSQLSEIKVNIVLKEILKELQKPLMRSPDEFTGKQGEIPCDVCNEGPKYKAAKSCLICLLSFCKRHLNGHHKVRFKGHKLVAPVNNLDQWACLAHGRPLELYSGSERKLICSLCVQEGTNMVSAEDEKDRKQVKKKNQFSLENFPEFLFVLEFWFECSEMKKRGECTFHGYTYHNVVCVYSTALMVSSFWLSGMILAWFCKVYINTLVQLLLIL